MVREMRSNFEYPAEIAVRQARRGSRFAAAPAYNGGLLATGRQPG